MKPLPTQTDESSLIALGEKASSLLMVCSYAGLASRFGYLKQQARPIGDAEVGEVAAVGCRDGAPTKIKASRMAPESPIDSALCAVGANASSPLDGWPSLDGRRLKTLPSSEIWA